MQKERMRIRDHLRILESSILGPATYKQQGVRINDTAFNALLAKSGMNLFERSKTVVTAKNGAPMVTTRVKRIIPYPGHPRSKNFTVDISTRNGSDVQSALVDQVAFLGHHAKHRRIRGHIAGSLTLGSASLAARLSYLAVNHPLPDFINPRLIDFIIPVNFPIIGEPHVNMTLLTTAAVGLGATGLAQILIRRPLHERKYNKKLENIRAYGRRVGNFVTV